MYFYMTNKMFEKMYRVLSQNKYTFPILDFVSYLKKVYMAKKVNKELLTNIEWFSWYNIPIEWFYQKKKKMN